MGQNIYAVIHQFVDIANRGIGLIIRAIVKRTRNKINYVLYVKEKVKFHVLMDTLYAVVKNKKRRPDQATGPNRPPHA